MSEQSPAERARIAVASLVFALGAPLVYAALRGFEQLRGGASDPTLIVRALHTTYYWRVSLSAWAAGLAALIVFGTLRAPRAATGADPAFAEKRLARRLSVLALVVVPLSALFVWVRP